MGQSQISELLLQVQAHPSSQRTRAQLWSLLSQGKAVINKEQTNEFFKELYKIMKDKDKSRKAPIRSWDSQKETVTHWSEAFKIEENDGLNKEYFDTALDMFHVAAKYDDVNKTFSLVEDGWEVVEADQVSAREAVQVAFQQLKTLVRTGNQIMKRNQGSPTLAKTQFEHALVIIDSLLHDSSPEVNPIRAKLQSKHFSIKHKLHTLDLQLNQSKKITPVSFQDFPIQVITQTCYFLDSEGLKGLGDSSRFFNGVLRQIVPVIRCTEFWQIHWKNLEVLIRGEYSYLMSLPSELHIEILSHLSPFDLMMLKGTCRHFRNLVIEMYMVEFEAMHLKNFLRLRDDLQEVSDYQKDAVETSSEIADGLFYVGVKTLPEGRGFGAAIGLVMIAVAGLMKLESWVGGPISGTIGKAVESVELNSLADRGKKDLDHCFSCKRTFTLFESKPYCRGCKMRFCDYCCSNTVLIPIRKRSYFVTVCNPCFKVIDEGYTTQDLFLTEDCEDSK